MPLGLLGRKVGMTQVYNEAGEVVPVTVIQAGPCHILQLRTLTQDGYESVQLGYLDKPRRLAKRSERGHVAKIDSRRSRRRSAAGVEGAPKAGCEPKRFVREFRCSIEGLSVGQTIDVKIFEQVKAVDITGLTKGFGFQGVMKRHHFKGQRASHGVKKVHRHPGGTGCNTFPARVFKGKRMAGRMGHTRVTARNLKLIKIDPENNLLLVCGAVPGPAGSYVTIRQTNKVG
jgi:large subunit ribosomal protein L3